MITETLPNGLQVLLYPSKAAPVAAIQIWVNAGSADEKPLEAGIAHVIEHMIFKGTPKRPTGQIAAEIETAGGEVNAWTSFDQTVYHVVIANRYFPRALDILADAVMNPLMDADELEKEKLVVLEEVKRMKDIPGRIVSQNLFATAFRHHPYRLPVIGTQETVQSFTRDDLVRFHQRWYVPENMVVVVTGDFETESTLRDLAGTLGTMRTGESPTERKRPSEERQEKLRAVVNRDDISEAYLAMSFQAPSLRHPDVAALDILTTLLGQGESSRLNREVRQKKGLVTEAYAQVYTPRDPGLIITGAIAPPETMEEAYKAILEEIFRFQHQSVTAEELLKARTMLESDAIYQKETMQGMARKFGYFQTVAGDVNYEAAYYAAVAQVTAEDIMRVARQYLVPERLTVSLLLPEKGDVNLQPSDLEGHGLKVSTRVSEQFAGVEVDAERRDVVQVVLDNGMTLLVRNDPQVPVVAWRAAFLGGLRKENPGNNGASNLVADLLTRGTSTRSAQDIARETDAIAGSLRGIAGRNSIGLQGYFLSRYAAQGLDLFADCLLSPTFSAEELDRARRIVLEEIKGQEDNLVSVAMRLFNSELYGDHPYSMNMLGTSETISQMNRDTLMDYYRQVFIPENMVLSVVGDVDPEWVVREVSRLFGDTRDWHLGVSQERTGKASPSPHAPVTEDNRAHGEGSVRAMPTKMTWSAPERPSIAFRYKDRNQAHLILGFPGTSLDDPEKYALEVLSSILSGQGGRLFRELRDRQGLAYSVTSFNTEGIDDGHFAVYMGTSPENLEKAISGINRELARIRDDMVTPEEMERAKQHLIGTHAVGLQRTTSRAAAMALNEAYGLGYDYHQSYPEKIQAVTTEDVHRAAARHIRLDAYTLSIVKPRDSAFRLPEDITRPPHQP